MIFQIVGSLVIAWAPSFEVRQLADLNDSTPYCARRGSPHDESKIVTKGEIYRLMKVKDKKVFNGYEKFDLAIKVRDSVCSRLWLVQK